MEKSQASGLSNWGTARLDAFVAVARRRSSSACALGESAAWRVRETTGAARNGAQRGSGAWPATATRTATTARHRTGEGGRENRERKEIKLIQNSNFFSKIPFET